MRHARVSLSCVQVTSVVVTRPLGECFHKQSVCPCDILLYRLSRVFEHTICIYVRAPAPPPSCSEKEHVCDECERERERWSCGRVCGINITYRRLRTKQKTHPFSVTTPTSNTRQWYILVLIVSSWRWRWLSPSEAAVQEYHHAQARAPRIGASYVFACTNARVVSSPAINT